MPRTDTSLVRAAYFGSDGQLTIRAMDALLRCEPDGELAVLLFKAQKASTRAKKYRGSADSGESYRDLAYRRKGDTLRLLAEFLDASGGECWGWSRHEGGPQPWVLYVELPNGQVSFHSPLRFSGRDYSGKWDGRHESQERILAFCESVLEEA